MPQGAFDFETILKVLARHETAFIIVGGLCAVLHGAPVHTYDLDIVPDRNPLNLVKLELALRELGAYYREHTRKRLLPEAARTTTVGHHLPFLWMFSAQSLAHATTQTCCRTRSKSLWMKRPGFEYLIWKLSSSPKKRRRA